MLALRVVNPARVIASGLGFVALLVTGAVLVRDPLPGEVAVLRAAHADSDGPAARFWQAVSDATDVVPLAVVAVVGIGVLVATGRLRSAGLLLASVAVPWTLNPVLKVIVGRDRPELWPLGDVSAHSLPAGHAANTAALAAGVVVVLLPRVEGTGRTVALAAAGAVLLLAGAAQLALGRHYPSDVLVGWLWATAWVALVVSLPLVAPRDRSARAP